MGHLVQWARELDQDRSRPGAGFMKPKLVIVGGGFAGLNAARALKGADVDITMIDRRNFPLFQLLYRVATAALNPSDIAYPIRSIFKRHENVVQVVLGEVTSVALDGRTVTVETQAVPYDYLVLATGATHSYFGRDEWEELAPGLKTVGGGFDGARSGSPGLRKGRRRARSRGKLADLRRGWRWSHRRGAGRSSGGDRCPRYGHRGRPRRPD